MQSKKIVASVACAVAAMSALSAQAIEIYPVDHARFMTNARFDFKVEGIEDEADRYIFYLYNNFIKGRIIDVSDYDLIAEII